MQVLLLALLLVVPLTVQAEYPGNLSVGTGAPYSNQSATNPFATDAPQLYDQEGNYRGRLSTNQYDPDSTSNPYGRYGSPLSPDSINNPFGAGNLYDPGSPTSLYGQSWSIEGR